MERQQVNWLRLEGLVALAIAVVLYADSGSSWLMFALLLLTPDLSMLGYLRNPRTGAILYNVGHSYTTVVLFWAVGSSLEWSLADPLALIWVAHIGLDRILGYGLKSSDAFKNTHLS
ncbi:MAG: DUF4260 domain-containing protein [Rhodothermales bacterium]|nr:DUF4260 domain-containing protein [Rhodothermales bacterium]MBO6779349.1 DUF4260 domain-containing protein [Rhodothermales bacterium]